MRSLAYHRPTSLAEAQRLKRELPGSAFIAGGTDVMVKLKGGEMRPEALISLRALSELEGITPGPTTRIGALTRMSALLESDAIRASFPATRKASSPFRKKALSSLDCYSVQTHATMRSTYARAAAARPPSSSKRSAELDVSSRRTCTSTV